MAKPGSGRTEPQVLTPARVAQKLKARGLKVPSQAELEQLTRMMNEEAAREAQAAAVDRFFDQFWAPVRKEQRAAAKRAARKKPGSIGS